MLSMICVNISGIAVSVKENDIKSSEEEIFPINKPTESYEVNTKVLRNIRS